MKNVKDKPATLSSIKFSRDAVVTGAKFETMIKGLSKKIEEIEKKRELNLDKLNSVVQF